MKRLLSFVLVAFIIPSIALAGIKKGDIRDNESYTKQINIFINNVQVHKVVAGMAEEELGPTFLRNDWGEIHSGSWSNLNS